MSAGLLWDRKVIPEVTHLQQSLDTMVNVSSDFNITVSYIDVTDKTPFQIYTLSEHFYDSIPFHFIRRSIMKTVQHKFEVCWKMDR